MSNGACTVCGKTSAEVPFYNAVRNWCKEHWKVYQRDRDARIKAGLHVPLKRPRYKVQPLSAPAAEVESAPSPFVDVETHCLEILEASEAVVRQLPRAPYALDVPTSHWGRAA